MTEYRKATSADIERMKSLIFKHGPNDWNHLPENEVNAHLDGIATGETEAMLALDGNELVGFITYYASMRLEEKYVDEEDMGTECGYIREAVVHMQYTGRGIGSQLAELVKQDLLGRGVGTIYVMHHEENGPSRKAWQRVGFEFVKTIDDPGIRPNGSRRTTVQRFVNK